MTDGQFKIEWLDRFREPQHPPDASFPNGKPITLKEEAKKLIRFCTAQLPYPAKRCGLYIVECTKCKLRIGVTTAGRPDDPPYVEMACGPDTIRDLKASGREPYEGFS
jgi:hypothetical protein